tara:strand:+ start:2954 stop:5251 length:2298 start_codon:yes stop_codon:yes gene_type:complete
MKYLSKCDDVTGCGKTYPGDMSHCPHCKVPEAFSSQADINPRDYSWDIETYPNCFTVRFVHIATDAKWRFEISEFKNDLEQLTAFVMQLKACKARGVGYNNVGFDYPVIHYIVTRGVDDVRAIYDFAMILIKGSKDDKFARQVWESDRLFEQVDLIMIWHYNKENPETGTEPTSLKALEIAMRSDTIEDLPFPVGTVLTRDEIEELHKYNLKDCVETIRFYVRSLTQIKLREELSITFGKSFINMSNTKMGGEILTIECEKAGIEFYDYVGRTKHKRQTIRASINLGECIFDYVKFERPEFEAVREFLASKTITETKGVFKGLNADVDGLKYYFGTGGIHASVEARIFESNDTHQIIDVDVASFYPNLAIKNKLHAAHLGVEFCNAYEGVYKTRKTYAKGTAENAAYKEALNANYGNSNNKYSAFLDPMFTMKITLNGQLLLCMLVEQMIKIPGLEMIQANTDGITYFCPREHIEHTRALCRWWEALTCLELEEALYSRMFIRDVNSYMAEYEGGAVKRIGAYAHERMDENPGTREVPYGKDPSQLIIPKAAEAALLRGVDIREFITNHTDNYDFMCRAKVPRSNKLVMRWSEYDNAQVELATIIRYFVSTTGGALVKIAPPTGELGTWKRKTKITDEFYNSVIRELRASMDYADGAGFTDGKIIHVPAYNHEWHGDTTNYVHESWHVVIDGKKTPTDSVGIPHDERIHTKNRSKHGIRELGICVGNRVTDCSNVANFDRSMLNIDYYVEQTEKLVKPLLTNVSK